MGCKILINYLSLVALVYCSSKNQIESALSTPTDSKVAEESIAIENSEMQTIPFIKTNEIIENENQQVSEIINQADFDVNIEASASLVSEVSVQNGDDLEEIKNTTSDFEQSTDIKHFHIFKAVTSNNSILNSIDRDWSFDRFLKLYFIPDDKVASKDQTGFVNDLKSIQLTQMLHWIVRDSNYISTLCNSELLANQNKKFHNYLRWQYISNKDVLHNYLVENADLT